MWQFAQPVCVGSWNHGSIDSEPGSSQTVPTTPPPAESRQQVVMRPSASTTDQPERRNSHGTAGRWRMR